MNIWLIQIGEALPVKTGIRKIRTAYLADELTKRGHNVLWWASAFDHFQKDWIYRCDTEIIINERYKIKTLKGCGYKKNISLARLWDHRIISKKFKRVAPLEKKPDIIIASLPSHDLAYEAIVFAEENRIPILVDIRDQWPDLFLKHVPLVLKNLARIVLRKDFLMTKKTLRGATGIISMMDEILEWGLECAQRNLWWTDNVFYLGYKINNSLDNKDFKKFANTLKQLKDKFVVTFIGTFSEYHNPSVLLECASRLKDNDKIHFVLAGDGQYMPTIQNKAASFPNLTLTGWINQAEIDALLKTSDVGVCTTNHPAYFFPNKAFAYFSAGLPVISSFQGTIKNIIEKHQVGFYYPPNNDRSLVGYILKLANDKILYGDISKRSKKLFNKFFDANIIYNNYADHIEKVASCDWNLQRD